jgi:hypothetical protein
VTAFQCTATSPEPPPGAAEITATAGGACPPTEVEVDEVDDDVDPVVGGTVVGGLGADVLVVASVLDGTAEVVVDDDVDEPTMAPEEQAVQITTIVTTATVTTATAPSRRAPGAAHRCRMTP